MGTLDKLVDNNTYPIAFIGSGISMRYLEDFPNWNGLLKLLWNKVNGIEAKADDNEFYQFMIQTRDDIKNENPNYSKEQLEYALNIKSSTLIEQKFNEKFIKGDLVVEGYNSKDYYEQSISPYKMEIANHFTMNNIFPDMEEEYESFKMFLSKTKIVLTTNYDELLEKSYDSFSENQKIDRFIGQKGFLRENTGWSELYKIHGCVTEPNSIVISEADYKKFDSNSVLISAKIISSLISAPIIFLGYSLKDVNVRKIIKDFASSIDNKDRVSGTDRIILVEYEEGKKVLEEKPSIERDLGCEITIIRTDNYKLLFDKLSEINEGVSSSFINRYQSLLKQMIIERGKKGNLQSLLISPTELSELEKNHDLRKNAAVVIGDSAILFVFPDTISYFLDYFSEEPQLNTDAVLRYIASQPSSSRTPFHYYINELEDVDALSLHSNERDKLKKRMGKHSSIEDVLSSINKYNSLDFENLESIKREQFKPKKEMDVICYNIKKLDAVKVKDYIVEKLEALKSKNEYTIDTPLRRLALAYDICHIKKK